MLERLAGPGNLLAKEARDAKEFDGLVRSGLARLKDAANEANSLVSRFDLAYGAAHALCPAALRHHGFRPSKRYIVFQVLPDTLGSGPQVWRVLSKCHDMRNRTEYEGALDVDEEAGLGSAWRSRPGFSDSHPGSSESGSAGSVFFTSISVGIRTLAIQRSSLAAATGTESRLSRAAS